MKTLRLNGTRGPSGPSFSEQCAKTTDGRDGPAVFPAVRSSRYSAKYGNWTRLNRPGGQVGLALALKADVFAFLRQRVLVKFLIISIRKVGPIVTSATLFTRYC